MATSSAALLSRPPLAQVQPLVKRTVTKGRQTRPDAQSQQTKEEKQNGSRFKVKTHYIVRGRQDHDYVLRGVQSVLLTKSMVDAIVGTVDGSGVDLSLFERAPGTNDATDAATERITLDTGIMDATRRHFKSGAPQRPIRAKLVEKFVIGPNHMLRKAQFYQVIEGHAKAAWSIALGYTHVPLTVTLGDADKKLTGSEYRSIDEGRI